MWEDLIIMALIVLALGAGAASVLLTNGLYKKYEEEYLKSFQYYLILLYIFGIYGILGTFIVRSLATDLPDAPRFMNMVLNFLPFLGVPFLLAGWYMLINMSFEMVNRTVNKLFTWFYFGVMVLFFLLYGVVLLNFSDLSSFDQEKMETIIKIVFLILDFLTLVVVLYMIYVRSDKDLEPGLRRAYFRFVSYILLARVSVGLLFYLSGNIVFSVAYLMLFFSANLLPVLYLSNLLSRFQAPLRSRAQLEIDLYGKLQEYDISPREFEIIEKICDGLSNQQISEVLFISLQTVKDHTHKIYKKLGVRNRVSLVNMMQNLG